MQVLACKRVGTPPLLMVCKHFEQHIQDSVCGVCVIVLYPVTVQSVSTPLHLDFYNVFLLGANCLSGAFFLEWLRVPDLAWLRVPGLEQLSVPDLAWLKIPHFPVAVRLLVERPSSPTPSYFVQPVIPSLHCKTGLTTEVCCYFHSREPRLKSKVLHWTGRATGLQYTTCGRTFRCTR